MRTPYAALVALCLAVPASLSAAKSRPEAQGVSAAAPLTGNERALQMLNRFTFGPRPGDLAAVRAMGGPEAWFARQLNPASIDDSALDVQLAAFPALALPPEQLAYNFPDRQMVRQTASGVRPMPQDPMLRGVYEVLAAKLKEKQAEKAETKAAAAATPAITAETGPKPAGKEKAPRDPSLALALATPLLALSPDQRLPAVMKLPVADRMVLTTDLPEPRCTALLTGVSPRDRDLFLEMRGGPNATGTLLKELTEAKVLRAVMSERQLEEVMTDFWLNHFNVFAAKGQAALYLPSYERDAIRAHALGKFKDLLLATAKHPAMLIYLDNWQSIGPHSLAASRRASDGKKPAPGLNENYGREVMELHTVGVSGGYTQSDVTALSSILTGWTIDRPVEGGPFLFNERRHEPGTKQWFGQTVHESGMAEGEKALEWLASRPQTAHFISYELAQRFVADQPPPALVDRMAKRYMATDGDIRQVLLAMVRATEFFARADYRNKVKTPLEFIASAMRATGTEPSNPAALAREVARMGEPLYLMQPPTGYPMTADHWMNSAALVDRFNFALQLSNGGVNGMRADAGLLLGRAGAASGAEEATSLPVAAVRRQGSEQAHPPDAIATLEEAVDYGAMTPGTDQAVRVQVASTPTAPLQTAVAMLLGSPEFQMR